MGVVEQIAFIPLFKDLPKDQQEDLAMIAVEGLFERGQTIFSEGEEGTGFYVVISGRVKIYKLSAEGREQILHIFGPGELFGEVPVFAGQHFPANADAIEESRVFHFPRNSLIDLIKKNPSIAMHMLAVLSMRLRRFTRLIDALSLKEVPGRLAAHLLYLSSQRDKTRDLELTITKGQLASLLGTIPETLSRILTRMSRQGLIESSANRIKILDRDALEELAEGFGRI